MHGKTVYLGGTSFPGPLDRYISSSQAVPSARPPVRSGPFTGISRPVLERHPTTSPTFAAATASSSDMSLMALSASIMTPETSPRRLITHLPHRTLHRYHILSVSVEPSSHLGIHHLFNLAYEMRLTSETKPCHRHPRRPGALCHIPRAIDVNKLILRNGNEETLRNRIHDGAAQHLRNEGPDFGC
ncbi:hypothetical protein BS47DRAFT_671596 [Hydnum rufescens UP504]|uniref:Uncharacterized protein n=1 Tax=Hydnum rufescens UP504 TaxID=1448309 RepID=A0A9P6DNB7_9AGAM|nr:hypothetical protein BS47DRAFT_671596 [Hydnum rufescens UP504]